MTIVDNAWFSRYQIHTNKLFRWDKNKKKLNANRISVSFCIDYFHFSSQNLVNSVQYVFSIHKIRLASCLCNLIRILSTTDTNSLIQNNHLSVTKSIFILILYFIVLLTFVGFNFIKHQQTSLVHRNTAQNFTYNSQA